MKREFIPTKEEVTIVKTLGDSSTGLLYYVKYEGGFELQIDNILLVGEADHKTRACWRAAVERLIEFGLLRDSTGSGGIFELTVEGHMAVEQVRNQKGREVPSPDAATMLIAALRGTRQYITRSSTNMGTQFHSGNKQFGEPGNQRNQARWIAAFDELFNAGLIEDMGAGQVFSVTKKGYGVGDDMRAARKRLTDRLTEGATAVHLCAVFMNKSGIVFPQREDYHDAREREQDREEAKELQKLRCAEERQDGMYYVTTRGFEVAQWLSDELDDDFERDVEERTKARSGASTESL